MKSRLLTLLLALLCTVSAYAQTNRYVSPTGDNASAGGQNAPWATLDYAITNADAGDYIYLLDDGEFAGANINKNITIIGDGAEINGALALTANDLTVSFEGIEFITAGTVSGTSNNSVVTISNCTFTSGDVVTANGWGELIVTNCTFTATGGATALDITNVGTTVLVTESVFTGYSSSAVIIGGTSGAVTVSYNEFGGNNTAAVASDGTLELNLGSVTGAVVVENNLFRNDATDNHNPILVSGGIAGKTITISENAILATASGLAIKHTGTGQLTATCNYYAVNGTMATSAQVASLYSGPVTVGPYDNVGTDGNGDAVGYEPAAGSCGGQGPIYNFNTMQYFFRLQEAIDAATASNTLNVKKGTYSENLTINKSLNIYGGYNDAWASEAVDARTGSTNDDAWTILSVTSAINITSGAGTVVIDDLKITSTTVTKLVSTNASVKTEFNDVWFALAISGVSYTSLGVEGVIHQLRAGDLIIDQSKFTNPVTAQFPYVRALTCAVGNNTKKIWITNSNVAGSIEVRGTSSMADVKIENNTIQYAGPTVSHSLATP